MGSCMSLSVFAVSCIRTQRLAGDWTSDRITHHGIVRACQHKLKKTERTFSKLLCRVSFRPLFMKLRSAFKFCGQTLAQYRTIKYTSQDCELDRSTAGMWRDEGGCCGGDDTGILIGMLHHSMGVPSSLLRWNSRWRNSFDESMG